MKRVTADELELLAYTQPAAQIVRNPRTNIATLRIGYDIFYAQYAAEVRR